MPAVIAGQSKPSLGLLQTKLSRRNSSSVAEDQEELLLVEKELKREAERASIFQKVSDDVLKVPNGYRKVEVLILRWHESIDAFQNHKEEIEILRDILEKDFGYNCTVETIRNNRPPQLALNRAISWHVEQHYEEGTLLIVYYTGHGNKEWDSKEGRPCLQLSAGDEWDKTKGSFQPTAIWNEAEEPLLTHAQGDVLVILDCCFAGMAAWKGNTAGLRAYQLLAASAVEGVTSGPGERSFTTALCQSLKELRDESNGGCFPVIKLMERINTKRLTQGAFIWDRLHKYGQHINLGPLDHSQEREESFRNQDPERASLVLRFSLKTADLGEDQIKSLARKLPEACKEVGVPIRQIQWVRMEEKDRQTIRKVLSAFKRNVLSAKMQKAETPMTEKIRVEQKLPSYPRNARSSAYRNSLTRRMTGRVPHQPVDLAAWQTSPQRPLDRQKFDMLFWRNDRFWFYLLKALISVCLLLAVPYSLKDRLKLVLLAVCIALVWLRGPAAVEKLDECLEQKAQKCSAISESIVEGLQRADTL